MSIQTRSVSFSGTNQYLEENSGQKTEFLAPADQVGDEEFNLEKFEASAPSSPPATNDPVKLVKDLVEINRIYKQRETRAIRHLRKSQRKIASLNIQLKSRHHLSHQQRDMITALKNEKGKLIECNQKYSKHSANCEKMLKAWKQREIDLLIRVSDRDQQILYLQNKISQIQKRK